MRSYQQYCALARSLDVVGDRWTLLIVRELLSLGPSRYSDLLRGLPGIATNLLADRLRAMEEAGLVTRTELSRPAPAMVIALTDRGTALSGLIREHLKWGAGLMSPPTPTETFQAHWLLLPLRALCRDNQPDQPRQLVRVGTASDGVDVAAEAGVITVTAADPEASPDATITGDPGALVALFAGQYPINQLRQSLTIDGDPSAVTRVVGELAAQALQ
jgi:DNA-binding HxlR family transcriptional regulator